MLVDAALSPVGDRNGKAILHFFGITEFGNSVQQRVHNFFRYSYVPVPDDVSADGLKRALNRRLPSERNRRGSRLEYVVAVDVVTKCSIMYYIPGDPGVQFLKIPLLNPIDMNDIAGILRRGSLLVRTLTGIIANLPQLLTFESILEYMLRFMNEVGLVGCSWLTMAPKNYSVVSNEEKKSLFQVEVEVEADDLIEHRPEGDGSKQLLCAASPLTLNVPVGKGFSRNRDMTAFSKLLTTSGGLDSTNQ